MHLSTLLEQQKSDILSSVQLLVKDKLENFKEKISSHILESHQEVTRTVQNNLEQRDLYTFKRKSNERQFKFNKSVINRATQTLSAVTSKEFSKATEILQEGMTELKGQQKLLKIADKSEHGWLTVEEYVGDKDLASDEADAQQIRKADKQAASKSKKLTVFNGRRPYNIPNRIFSSNHVVYQQQK